MLQMKEATLAVTLQPNLESCVKGSENRAAERGAGCAGAEAGRH